MTDDTPLATTTADQQGLFVFEGVVLTETSLTLSPGVTFDRYCEIAHMIETLEGAVNWWLGDLANQGDPAFGDKMEQAFEVADELHRPGMSIASYRWVAERLPDFTRVKSLSWTHHREVSALDTLDERVYWLDQAVTNKWSSRELRKALDAREDHDPPPLPEGVYSTIVADPPWRMAKIRRDSTPSLQLQQTMDYPTMTVEAIKALPVEDHAADDAHLYLWTTQKFLPDALEVCEAWGFKYQCLLTWVKPGGFTPFSWMYTTEHVLFCTRGDLPLLRMGMRLDFDAPRTGHSSKPDVFYDIVTEASPGPRLEMFARQQRDGFTVWGNEA